MNSEPFRPHTLSNFTTALDQLRESVLMMANLAQKNIKTALKGLLDRDNESCKESLLGDEAIDSLEMQIDREGIELMSRFQPVASDLREVISSIKIGANIERIADQGVGIARRACKLNEHSAVDEMHLLDNLIEVSLSMFDDAVLSFAQRDDSLAMKLKSRDKLLDRLNAEATATLVTRMQDDATHIPSYLHLIFVSRFLERIGDFSCNIAEDVVFAVRAKDIRHLGLLD